MAGERPDSLRAAPRRLAGLVRTAWPKRELVAEALVRLVAAEAKLRLVPLKRQGMGDLQPPSGPPLPPGSDSERRIAADVGWAVTRTAAYLPFSPLCLAQALTARAMLRRRGIATVLHVGVARPDAAGFEAHAWLEAAGVEVTGYPVPAHFRGIGCLRSDGGKGR